MPEGGFYERRRISPTGVAVVLVLHGAALTALAMSKMDMPVMKVFNPLEIENITIPPDPEPIPDPQPQPKSQPKQQLDSVAPIVRDLPTPRMPDLIVPNVPDVPIFTPRPSGQDIAPPSDPPKPTPKADPVRAEAQMLRSTELQPPYPASEMRAQAEGSVVIRVIIGANGRVVRAEKVSATSSAFYEATERHALRSWRFKPATVDGSPVESTKVITVRFRLDD